MAAAATTLVQRRGAEEAARGALLAAHAASGLSVGCSPREVQRLLRAAEGLLRTAVAILSTAPSSAPAPSAAEPPVHAASVAPRAAKRRQRPRSKALASKEKAAAEKTGLQPGGETAIEEKLMLADGSILFGDLSELRSGTVGGGGDGEAAPAGSAAAAPSSAVADARAEVRNLDEAMLLALARTLGWSGPAKSRRVLVQFCVARKLAEPAKSRPGISSKAADHDLDKKQPNKERHLSFLKKNSNCVECNVREKVGGRSICAHYFQGIFGDSMPPS